MWSLYALILGFFLDLIVGDPHWMPHPIVFIGKLIDVTVTVFKNIFYQHTRSVSRAEHCHDYRL